MKLHIKEVHEKIKTHDCEMCNRTFSRPNLLIGHIKSVHEKIKNFSCDFCPYKSAQKNSLKKHLEIWHSNIQRERNYKCHTCDKRFYDSRHLQIHVNEVHKKIRNHQCIHCNKFFSRNYLLKCHYFKVHNFSNWSTPPKELRNEKRIKTRRCYILKISFTYNAVLHGCFL